MTQTPLHPKLVEYRDQFTFTGTPIQTFYTQHKISEYPFSLPCLLHIEGFVARLMVALQKQESICIYSDYDADAVTATAVMYWGLRELGFSANKLSFYVPDRFREGYGLNLEAIEKLSQVHDLIVSVDCGINSREEATLVTQTNQCDLIITDHHQLTGELPVCSAVINPQLTKEAMSKYLSSPSYHHWQEKYASILKELTNCPEWLKNPKVLDQCPEMSQSVTGVGVAWFAVVWLGYSLLECSLINTNQLKKLNTLLPFVAIGTIADCQSILDYTNRYLVHSGLQMLQKGHVYGDGLAELMKQTGLSEKISGGYRLGSQDLGFLLAPILNASGRLTHASHSIASLVVMRGEPVPYSPVIEAKDIVTAEYLQELISELISVNQSRKDEVKSIVSTIDEVAKAQVESGQSIIWLEGNWSKGIIGLVASRLVNQHNLPTVVVAVDPEKEEASASMRAPGGFHLAQAIAQSMSVLIKGGGHPGAAGMSVLKQHISQARLQLQEAIVQSYDSTRVTNSEKNKGIEVTPEILPLLAQEMWKLEPFGQDFPMPLFSFPSKIIQIQPMGNGNHLRITLQGNIEIVAFSQSQDSMKQFEIAQTQSQILMWLVKVSQNTWKGTTRYQYILESFQVA